MSEANVKQKVKEIQRNKKKNIKNSLVIFSIDSNIYILHPVTGPNTDIKKNLLEKIKVNHKNISLNDKPFNFFGYYVFLLRCSWEVELHV